MRKILLVISLAIFAVCFMFPCLILPFGTYKGETEVLGEKIEYSIKFQIGGKVKAKIGEDGKWEESYYKLKGSKIIVSDDKTFNDEDVEVSIINANKISVPLYGTFTNTTGIVITVAVLIVDLFLIVTIPKKKK